MAPSTQGGMFHTFVGVTPRKPAPDTSDGSKRNGRGVSKRVTTLHACAECKRRKIRCDGEKPCIQCRSGRDRKICYYEKPRQRVAPSKKAMNDLSESLQQCETVLKRLFPSQDVKDLVSYTRQELLLLIEQQGTDPTVSALPSPPLNSNASPESEELSSGSFKSEQSFSMAERLPTQDTECYEDCGAFETISTQVDDIDALSLAVSQQTSTPVPQAPAMVANHTNLLLSTAIATPSTEAVSKFAVPPVGFESGTSAVGTTNRQGRWDLDGMSWEARANEELAAAAAAATGTYPIVSQDGVLPLQYIMMTTNPSSAFPFVQ